jgi:L-ascorbate metabolism protein UlaG (beta-lactamase superfamily)
MNRSKEATRQRADPLGKQSRSLILSLPVILVVSLLFATCSDAPVSQAGEPAPVISSAPIDGAEPLDQAAGVTITYLANEGFLLQAGEDAVLIDALFGDGLAGYPTVPQPLRDELEDGRGRFRGIDCVLATHFHGDHFNPQVVARFLSRVPAQFISTREAVENVLPALVSREGPDPHGLRPARHQVEVVDCGGVSVSAMSFHHGRLGVKNLAFLVDFDGLTILHVGDTEITADEIRPWRLVDRQIDVALLPAWHLTEPTWLPIIEEIGARHLVAMHLASADAPSSWFGSAGSLEGRIAEIQRQVPTAWIPIEAMERRVFAVEE